VRGFCYRAIRGRCGMSDVFSMIGVIGVDMPLMRSL
jgi:hypothetical protein